MSPLRGFLVGLEQGVARHQHPRRAVAALQAVLLEETLLHGVELAVLLEALHGHDLAAVGLDSEDGAGLHGPPVEEHCAGPAVGGVASDVGAGETEDLPDEVHEEKTRVHLGLVGGAVHGDLDLVLRHG